MRITTKIPEAGRKQIEKWYIKAQHHEQSH